MCASAFWTSSGSSGFSQPPEIHQLQKLGDLNKVFQHRLLETLRIRVDSSGVKFPSRWCVRPAKKNDVVQVVFFRGTSCVPLSHCRAQDAVASASSPINYDSEEWQWLRTQFDDKDALCWSQKEDDLSPEGRMKRGAYLRAFGVVRQAKDRFPNMATKSGQWRGSFAP